MKLPDDVAAAFAPYEDLAARLLPALPDMSDGSHDIAHLLRVCANVRAIQAEEGGDLELLAAACLLHDCVAVEKNSGLRTQASRLAAERAADLLTTLGWPETRIASVAHAIEAHSFSAGVTPTSVEACILQDADRLDAIGVIGVARCFYTAGRMGSALYDPGDSAAQRRPLDDVRNAVDHFHAKLLHLASGFRTTAGQQLARVRHERMVRFLNELADETGTAMLPSSKS